MGLSASQMRFLQLTQRKSDVEYQGQQINQSRTTLASESAALNSQLMGLAVPTPPSSGDYSKTTYSFDSNGETNTITSADYNTDGTYNVNYTYDTTVTKAENTGLSVFSNTAATGQPPRYVTTAGTELKAVITDPTDPNYNAADITNVAMVTADCGVTGPFYKYGVGEDTKYVSEQALIDNANSTRAVTTYGINNKATETQKATLARAEVAWSDTGRMESVKTADGRTYNLTVNTTADESAFTNANNEYEYKKSLYQQTIDTLNAKLSIIQGQDKSLELKLKDCDTQHNAVQTELDAVKKVIDKSIESSFKTFG